MIRRITWLVAASTSAVVVAFVLPLVILISGQAEQRAAESARQQAATVATLVATLDNPGNLGRAVADSSLQGPAVIVVRPDDTTVGSTVPMDTGLRQDVEQARRERAAFTSRHGNGVDGVAPVALTDGIHVVVARIPSDELRSGVPEATGVVVLLGLALVLLSVLAARNLARRIAVPVIEVADVAHRLREGDADARAVPGGPAETRELGRALNALADRIHDLVAAERENVADLGHRLRTPVTALRLDADLVSDPELNQRLRDHVDHLRRSIDDVVREARRPLATELTRATELTTTVRDRVAFWKPLAEDSHRPLTLDQSGGDAWVSVGRDDADELVDTLLDNVFAHTPEGTRLRVGTVVSDETARLVVEDSGPGMPRPWAGRGDSAAGSTGLGLAIVHRVAEAAGGSVRLGRSDLGGLRVEVDLPLDSTA
ncbi:HAMP domain-containing histidine kinase [Phycicoccus sp. CSK15P-2]|uniref:sensor histidine kinase n=1 Tax=Phycicoccus sp. CSK15P-2 TaxID=2807627 RepID=UPI00194FADFF|nr:HAMP domain-containing sensor histidine kinase [Phycicoccus sp. CSK15P-2]MBM6404657.1 HAMP domain-containing histidine kinase [Phycicoccus sp. CSK15P-2]